MSWAIVGIGNRLAGDDAAGPAVVDLLKGRVPEGVEVLELSGDLSRLVDVCAGRERLILVDAARDEAATAGTVTSLELATGALPPGHRASSSHALSLSESVELCRSLGVLPPRVELHAIVTPTAARSLPGLSPAVAAAVGRVAGQIRRELENADLS